VASEKVKGSDESAGLATMVDLSAKDRLFGTLIGPLQNVTYYAAIFSLVIADPQEFAWRVNSFLHRHLNGKPRPS
jgi:hypothetical protein